MSSTRDCRRQEAEPGESNIKVNGSFCHSDLLRLPNGRGIVKERCKLPRNLLSSLVGEGGCQMSRVADMAGVRGIFQLEFLLSSLTMRLFISPL